MTETAILENSIVAAEIVASEDGGSYGTEFDLKDLIDRLEIIWGEQIPELINIRRAYNDRDLSSIFALSDNNELRKAVMEQNLHSIFRLLESCEPLIGTHEDLRKAIVEQNLYALFRILENVQPLKGEHEDIRKAALETNLHSLFRVLENYEPIVGTHEDLRKAIVEQNLRSLFRVLEDYEPIVSTHEDLRKAIVEQNLRSLFRILENYDSSLTIHADLKKAVISQDIAAILRLFRVDPSVVNDFKKAIKDRNFKNILRLFNDTDILQRAVIDHDLFAIFKLYSGNEDLKKAMIQKDLYATFRLYGDSDDIKKAVANEDLYAIFRLLNAPDMRKLVMNHNRPSLYRLLENKVTSQLVLGLRRLEYSSTPFYHDCLSRGQIRSKIWIVDILKDLKIDLGTVFLCGGWYATLATMIFESDIPVERIYSYDIDPDVVKIADSFNLPWVQDEWKFKAIHKDILDINYNVDESSIENDQGTTTTIWASPDTVINTSCEHIQDFHYWYSKIPKRTLLILQTNDYKNIPDHVNCCESLKEFSEQTPMEEVLWQGELYIGKYTRFMRIGFR